MPPQMDEEEMFNADYKEVDRVLDESCTTDPVSGEESKYYLVKWSSMSYEESTWELEADVDKKKIEDFHRFKEVPPEDQREV